MRLREVDFLAQGHTAAEGQCWDLDPGNLASELLLTARSHLSPRMQDMRVRAGASVCPCISESVIWGWRWPWR